MELISFVIPCYNSSKTIGAVVEEIKHTVEALHTYEFEIVLVNDGSKDNVFEIIKEICETDSRIKGISFSQNFGQGSAIMAGLNYVSGDIVTILDDDGQCPVDELPKLLKKIDEGYDAVYGEYAEDRHTFFRKITSKINEAMNNILLGTPKDLYMSSFFVCRKYIAEEIVNYKNPFPAMYGLVLRTTKNIANVTVSHRERQYGKSNYSFLKLLSLWLNGFTAFSVKPLRIASVTGACCTGIGGIYGLYVIIRRVLNPNIMAGYSSLMAILLFIGGMIMLMLGLIGEYVGRIYICINNSPQYIIRQTVNLDRVKNDAVCKKRQNIEENLW